MKLTQRKVSGGNEYSISGSPDERKYLEGEIIRQIKIQNMKFPSF